jgi:hypothetical protein
MELVLEELGLCIIFAHLARNTVVDVLFKARLEFLSQQVLPKTLVYHGVGCVILT